MDATVKMNRKDGHRTVTKQEVWLKRDEQAWISWRFKKERRNSGNVETSREDFYGSSYRSPTFSLVYAVRFKRFLNLTKQECLVRINQM